VAICAACGYETTDQFRFCPECGARADPAGREQRKIVTVLFCDVTGSTAFGESLDPEALRVLLARYFERMKRIVERHGGVVEKFIGDAVMAVFGLPAVHEDDALRAIHAATEMQPALTELGIECRVGICSGEVVTGTEERLATGDTVNVAARLQQAAEPGQILLGESTLRLAGGAVEAEAVEPLALKGKSEPVPAWRLVAVSTAAEPRFDSPLVGREQELQTLAEAWERACSAPACELVTVVGAAGLGKSRLVAEFVGRADATIVRGRCLSYGEGITYWPVVEVLKQLEAHRSRVVLDPVAAEALGAFLGHEDTARTDEIAWAFRKLLEAVAAERPLVAVFDDIQWAEDVLLDLLEHVAFLSTDAPILLLCMARPELLDRRSGWGGVLRLQPLDTAEAETLMTSRLADQALGADTRERILHAAGGNPLFVEEMAAMVQATGNGEIEVPPTLQALIAARLDQLDQPERSVLERGSVEGEVFHHRVVQALAPEGQRVTSQLTALVRKELIRPDRPLFAGDDAFRFRHLLVRDAAYDALPKSDRAELHEQFADWLEQHGTELVELDELLGYHLEQAFRYRRELGQTDGHAQDLAIRAGNRLSVAGARAAERRDFVAGIGLLERAAELLPDDHRDARFELALAWARFNNGRGRDAVIGGLDAAIERARTDGDRVRELTLRLEHAQYRLVFEWEEPEATLSHIRAVIAEAQPVLEATGDNLGLAELYCARILVAEMDCAYSDVATAAERVIEHARLADYGWLVDFGESNVFNAICSGATPVDDCLRWLDDHPDFERRGVGLQRARLLAMLGRFDESYRLQAYAADRAAELGTVRFGLGLQNCRLEVAMLEGDSSAAEASARELCETAESTGELGSFMWDSCCLAQALLELDRDDEAEEWLERGQAAPDPMPNAQMLGHRVRAKALARRGELEEGERLAREAVAIGETTDMLNDHAAALLDLAEVLALASRDARAELEAALALYQRKGNLVMAGRTSARLSE
jgi:class 3 adenylate cyclase/tetratricopeptide (TPR) repeat protein